MIFLGASTKALLGRKRRKSISLTPLIDVVFILLMFFMLTSNFTQWRSINFTSASSSSAGEDRESYFLILFADRHIELLGSDLSLENHQKIRADTMEYFENAGSVVLIPENSVELQAIVSTLDGLKKIGLSSVVLAESLSRQELAELQ